MSQSPASLRGASSGGEPELRSVEALCALREPYASTPETDRLFVEAMREIVRWHATRSTAYARALEARAFDPATLASPDDCARVPYLAANFFKAHEVLSVPQSSVVARFTSSGTLGQKSQIFFDARSLAAAKGMLDSIIAHNGFATPDQPTNYLLFGYELEKDSRRGTSHTSNILTSFAPLHDVFYALRLTGDGGHDFDVYGCIETLRRYEREGLPVRIFGFPSFLYFTLERMRALGVPPVKLPAGSLALFGGGWKAHADKAIEKPELYARITEQLGIPDGRIRDGFGSVEHPVPYTECVAHRFHVPVWSRVFARDLETLEVLPRGERGLLHLVSPYVTSMPSHSVLMTDLASVHDGAACPCGATTPYFVVHGRAGTQKNRSCAVAASEILRRS